MDANTRFLVLAEGRFDPFAAKTAASCIRYTPERVVAVIDSTHAGRTVEDVLGFGGAIPIVASDEAGYDYAPTALLIGVAPSGGALPPEWRATIRRAIARGLDLWSGLHFFLGDDPEFQVLAATHGVTIRDLRKPPTDLTVAVGAVRGVAATVVLTVGTDANIGKMTAALQVRARLRDRGRSAAFAGTGQTGILIEGHGISIDAVVADFIAGATERLVVEAASGADIVLVEGQGSLLHPSFSGVTLGLLHGAMPHALVMCTQPTRTHLRNHPWVRIPPLPEVIAIHERLAAPLRPAPVVAISLNTFDLSDADARAAIARAADETGLPATDPVRYDPAPIADAIEAVHARRVGA